MARCFNDRREALSLMHSAYVRAGLPSQSENALRVSRHQLLPRSRIFVAKVDGRVVSTLSLVPDSPAGLPLDELDCQALDQVRSRRLRIAEVGCFADRRQEHGRPMKNFCSLLRFVAQYAVVQEIDGLVIAGHPRRSRFLQNYLGFQDVRAASAAASGEDQCAAIPLWLDFEQLKIESPEKHRWYFAASVSPKDFAGGFMPRWEAEYFGRPTNATAPLSLAPFSQIAAPAACWASSK